jgi:hypothetical protein
MAGIRGAAKSIGHRKSLAVKRLSAAEEWKIARAADQLMAQAKNLNDLAANQARTDLANSAAYYAGLFTSLYAAVNAASADYIDIMNMKDTPEIGEALFDGVLSVFKLFTPGTAAIAEALKAEIEAVENSAKIAKGVGKVFEYAMGGDPNAAAKSRIAAARSFFGELDKASKRIQSLFADARSIIDTWQFSPQGDLRHLVRVKLSKLKVRLDVPDGVDDPTALFTDFFLYDMVKAYVKATDVTLRYNNHSLSFPGGDYTHLSPDDHYFDEAGGKYVIITGLNEESCKQIYEMLGKRSKHTHELYRAHRPAISRPGDFVTVWGVPFYRNDFQEELESDGTWANPDEHAFQMRRQAQGFKT